MLRKCLVISEICTDDDDEIIFILDCSHSSLHLLLSPIEVRWMFAENCIRHISESVVVLHFFIVESHTDVRDICFPLNSTTDEWTHKYSSRIFRGRIVELIDLDSHSDFDAEFSKRFIFKGNRTAYTKQNIVSTVTLRFTKVGLKETEFELSVTLVQRENRTKTRNKRKYFFVRYSSIRIFHQRTEQS